MSKYLVHGQAVTYVSSFVLHGTEFHAHRPAGGSKSNWALSVGSVQILDRPFPSKQKMIAELKRLSKCFTSDEFNETITECILEAKENA